jgi:rhamnose utilization protein RhaD (predicted bifunctional aldolase and dehydrogenase)/NAD(P)-dependent dehydrogenase (short-subunit alcohol dehydrogenase family)
MVRNRWKAAEARQATDEVAQRVYTTRLLGQDPSLVLHGGGNTSVKVTRPDILGADEELLIVKGSGGDMGEIDESGFTTLRLHPVVGLASLKHLSDVDMVRLLASYKTDAEAPAPSVEAILHALLPYRFIDHTHANAVLTLTNTPRGEKLVRKIYGDDVVILPYVMPGFDLAKQVADNLSKFGPKTAGLVILNHGIFTFGSSAKQAYDRMIDLVSKAEAAIKPRKPLPTPKPALPHGVERRETVAALRGAISQAAGVPVILSVHDDDVPLAFAQGRKVGELSQHGPVTPDHVIRTKPVPMVGRDVAAFSKEYEKYFARGAKRARTEVEILDTAPRVVLDRELGLLTAGRTAKDARIAEDVYRHTIDMILDSEALGGYRPTEEDHLFDVEYWDLQQAKLRYGGAPKPLAGQVALVTGAASGIGRAIAGTFLEQGAAVVGLDLNEAVVDTFSGDSWLGIPADVTNLEHLTAALDATSDRFGGLDIVVLNAGIFPKATHVKELDLALWQRVIRINLDSAVELLRETHPLLKHSLGGGRVVVIGSKNVAAPGPGASAYSASKAALVQLARVIALEWAEDGIRVNVIHPDAVFDTGLWGGGVLEARAKHYGVSVDDYRKRNLLHVEITSGDVAQLALSMVGPAFAKTTGAQVSIDGGNDRVI